MPDDKHLLVLHDIWNGFGRDAKETESALHMSAAGRHSTLTDQVVHNVQGSLSPIRAELKLISADTARYAKFAHISARKMAILALVIGASAGVGATTLFLHFFAS